MPNNTCIMQSSNIDDKIKDEQLYMNVKHWAYTKSDT